jgi:hypothetical protein
MSRTLSEDRDVPFLPKPNSVALVLSNRMPPEDLVVTALGPSACKRQVARFLRRHVR